MYHRLEGCVIACKRVCLILDVVSVMFSPPFRHFDNNHSWISDSGFVNTVMEIVVKATEVLI